MRVSDFNDIARESEIYDENISRSEMTNLLLKKYNLFEIRDIIYDKYMEKKSYSKERLELEEKIKEFPEKDLYMKKSKELEHSPSLSPIFFQYYF